MTLRATSGHCLFDDLIGECKQLLRRLKAQRLGSPEVDNKLKLGWCLNREVGGLGALQNAINVAGRLARLFGVIAAVTE